MSIVLLRSVDLETSAKEGGEPVELGMTDVYFDTAKKTVEIGVPRSTLHWPMRGMGPETIAIHHITLDQLDGKPVCTPDVLQDLVMAGAPDFLVAHNASFEKKLVTPDLTGDTRWICTFHASLRAWEEAPEHNLQALRYWRGLDLDPALAMPPHRAGPDSYVGAHVLAELLKTETVNDLVRWTREPRYYRTCPLQKHRGQTWDSIPMGYLRWMLSAPDMEHDLKMAANAEVNARAERGT